MRVNLLIIAVAMLLIAASQGAARQKPAEQGEMADVVGIALELRLPAPSLDAGDPPLPSPSISADDAARIGIRRPQWLPPRIVAGEPNSTVYYLNDGSRVGQSSLQLDWRSGELPQQAIIVQLDGADGAALSYSASPSGYSPLSEGTVARSRENPPPAATPPAVYSATTVRGFPAEEIALPPTASRGPLHGVRWTEGAAHFYVGGTLPRGMILQIAKGLAPEGEE